MSTPNPATLDEKTVTEAQMIDLITPGAAAASAVPMAFLATANTTTYANAAASATATPIPMGSAASATPVMGLSAAPRATTRLRDLPANVIRLLPPSWNKEQGINEPIESYGTTPLMWTLNPNIQDKIGANNSIIIFDALLACPDLDPNKGDGVTIPLSNMIYGAFACKGYVKRMLMKGADLKITHRQFASFVPESENPLTKFLNIMISKMPRNIYSAYTYRQDKWNGAAVDLFEHIWENELRSIEIIKGIIGILSSELLHLIHNFNGPFANLDDLSIAPLSDTDKTWILEIGSIFHAESLKEEAAFRAENEREAREKQARVDAENRRERAIVATEEHHREIDRLKETVATQAIEMKQMKEQLATLQAQMARLLPPQVQSGIPAALPGFAVPTASAAPAPATNRAAPAAVPSTPASNIANSSDVPPAFIPTYERILRKQPFSVNPQSGPDSDAHAGIDNVATSPDKVGPASGAR